MINNLKYQFLTGWHLTRWIRLTLGIALLVQAIVTNDLLVGAFAILLLGQAATNTGCCGQAGCSIPQSKTQNKDTTGPTT